MFLKANSCRDNSKFKLNSRGPMCLRQCFSDYFGVDCSICTVLLEGQETSLHVVVSVRGILEVLEDAHFVPLLAASDIFSLKNGVQ